MGKVSRRCVVMTAVGWSMAAREVIDIISLSIGVNRVVYLFGEWEGGDKILRVYDEVI